MKIGTTKSLCGILPEKVMAVCFLCLLGNNWQLLAQNVSFLLAFKCQLLPEVFLEDC